ncbi:MAG: hypothetical protein M3Q55_15290 [Acidobacteriota bacterium]|nr:hypothetical protein [Acidobacteriota bacterium]
MKKLRNLRERMRRKWRRMAPVLLPAAVIVMLAALAAHCSGCGGALQTSARALAITTVAVDGAEEATMGYAGIEFASCTVPTCPADVERRFAPATVASASLRAALVTWDSSNAIALQAGADDGVMQALLVAAARVVARWDSLVAALRQIGYELPPLPPMVRSLVASIGGE